MSSYYSLNCFATNQLCYFVMGKNIANGQWQHMYIDKLSLQRYNIDKEATIVKTIQNEEGVNNER